ncbi:tannase/feruloyl esterase family alpha/beta hydrolase [Egicoccus halophilus]|nr:tannase/feruloyl esterase family alpha/beta hydrolase [Egicoccus halophilus]
MVAVAGMLVMAAPMAHADANADACADLAGTVIPAADIGLPTNGAQVVSAVTTSGGGLPEYCRVEGRIAPVDPEAPDIRFRVNLPVDYNGRAMHFGGGGYNGTVVAATGTAPSAPAGTLPPLARGYATFGSDSGHEGGNASFALNDEAMVNFGYAALKKTRDVAVELMHARYGAGPEYTYFVGSSQGGREAVTVAQRFPHDYDGILSRVPVLNFTGLQVAGNRMGAAIEGGGWMNAAEIALLDAATMAACDGLDGLEDGIITRPDACDFDPGILRCPGGQDAGSHCLSDAQLAAVSTLYSPVEFDADLANGVPSYPAWPIGHQVSGGFGTWVMGGGPPGGLIVNFGSQFVRYFIAQDPDFDTFAFDHNDPQWRERIEYVSSVVDSTDPDLSEFAASGGKLIIQEHLGDYAQSGMSGIRYYESVVDTLNRGRTRQFLRMYVSPGADHGGGGAPAQVDWVDVLERWVEDGQPPARDITQAQGTQRTRPVCEWPDWPRYRHGDPNRAESFHCMKAPGFPGAAVGRSR